MGYSLNSLKGDFARDYIGEGETWSLDPGSDNLMLITQTVHHNYYYPNPKNVTLGYLDPLGKLTCFGRFLDPGSSSDTLEKALGFRVGIQIAQCRQYLQSSGPNVGHCCILGSRGFWVFSDNFSELGTFSG